jgi:hypothetical protein
MLELGRPEYIRVSEVISAGTWVSIGAELIIDKMCYQE